MLGSMKSGLRLPHPTAPSPLNVGMFYAGLKTFLFAGHDTTSCMLTWTLYYTLAKPDLQQVQDVVVSGVACRVRDIGCRVEGGGCGLLCVGCSV